MKTARSDAEPINHSLPINSQTIIRASPVFIVGAQRSGTTMLRLMLNMHPNLVIPFESVFIPEIYRQLDSYGSLDCKENIARLLEVIADHPFVRRGKLIQDKTAILACNPRTYSELVRAIYAVYAESKGKPRWGDKTPSYVTEIDVLRHLFPDCLVIHIVRDGRDVAVSRRGLHWGSTNLPKLARDWSWQVTLGHKMGAMLDGRYLEIRYEDLVLEPEATLVKVCHFIGEPYSSKMLDYSIGADSEMPAESLSYHRESVQPPNRGKVLMWKQVMSREDQIIFEQVAGETLEVFGYELRGIQSTWRTRLKNLRYALIDRW